MTSSLVFVHDALSDHFVDHGQCLHQSTACGLGIFGFNSAKNSLNVGAHSGALASVMGTTLFGLSSTFLCLRPVSQGDLPKRRKKEAAICR